MRLLSELTPRLQAAKIVERQLDRYLARRFNVFKYLREDELGLSHMIADLLNPASEHGQGTRFLEAMLDALPETRGCFGQLRSQSADPIRVAREHCTTEGRFIDITVDIPTPAGRFCLAFENKPYAADQDGQAESYLEYLRTQYGARFLLVYLPPVHRWPDEASLPQADSACWKDHFRIMPYTGGEASLQDWFATCRKQCDADRVSLFLKDAESFCQQRFGESTMTNAETRFVSEYLSDNPSHLRAALAVHDAWPLWRADVCQRFLEHLRRIVEKRLPNDVPGVESDFRVRCSKGERKSSDLWITRDAWVRYHELPPNKDGRTTIRLQSAKAGPTSWYWGVCSPKPLDQLTEAEKERHEELCAALGRRGLSLANDKGDRYAQWEWLSSRYGNWHSRAPDLYEECEAGKGPITTYYVNGLIDIAQPKDGE